MENFEESILNLDGLHLTLRIKLCQRSKDRRVFGFPFRMVYCSPKTIFSCPYASLLILVSPIYPLDGTSFEYKRASPIESKKAAVSKGRLDMP